MLSWLWSVIFFSFSLIFVLYSVSLTKLLTFTILFSTTLREILVANLVLTGVLPLISFILALTVVLVAKLLILGILSSTFSYLSIIYIFSNNTIFYYLT